MEDLGQRLDRLHGADPGQRAQEVFGRLLGGAGGLEGCEQHPGDGGPIALVRDGGLGDQAVEFDARLVLGVAGWAVKALGHGGDLGDFEGMEAGEEHAADENGMEKFHGVG